MGLAPPAASPCHHLEPIVVYNRALRLLLLQGYPGRSLIHVHSLCVIVPAFATTAAAAVVVPCRSRPAVEGRRCCVRHAGGSGQRRLGSQALYCGEVACKGEGFIGVQRSNRMRGAIEGMPRTSGLLLMHACTHDH